jgi:flagellar protein FlbT
MPLKVELKPGERLLIGNCVVTNADQRTRFFIEGKAPILREKDILTADTADTPARQIYFAVQLMYVDDDIEKFRDQYFTLVNDLVKAAPSTMALVDQINNEILTGSLYKALRITKQLVEYEQEILTNAASSRPSLPKDGQPNR